MSYFDCKVTNFFPNSIAFLYHIHIEMFHFIRKDEFPTSL